MVAGIENIIVSSEEEHIEEEDISRSDELLLDDGSDLYNRQATLGITTPSSVTIIGAGGVGSWVALDFALIGVKYIAIIDHDKVDVSNLNRTMFESTHIGRFKSICLQEMILKRRPNCLVTSYTTKYEDLPEVAQSNIKTNSIVIDCRDSIKPLDGIHSPIIGGYNGLNATIHIEPVLENIFGEEESPYTVTPSYVIVPMTIASLIVNYVCVEHYRNQKESVINIDFNKLIKYFDRRVTRRRSKPKEVTE